MSEIFCQKYTMTYGVIGKFLVMSQKAKEEMMVKDDWPSQLICTWIFICVP